MTALGAHRHPGSGTHAHANSHGTDAHWPKRRMAESTLQYGGTPSSCMSSHSFAAGFWAFGCISGCMAGSVQLAVKLVLLSSMQCAIAHSHGQHRVRVLGF